MTVYSYIDPMLGVVQTDDSGVEDVLTESGTIVNRGRRAIESAHPDHWILTGPEHPEGLFSEDEAAHWVATGALPVIRNEPQPVVRNEATLVAQSSEGKTEPEAKSLMRLNVHIAEDVYVRLRIFSVQKKLKFPRVAETAIREYLDKNAIA